jgi:hypothetical protein
VSNEPIVFIGPGSEWFWTAVSGIILAITFVAIWRQLSLARSVNAFEQLTRLEDEWGNEAMTRAKLEVARALVAGDMPPYGPATFVGNFCERMGNLVKAGHVGARLVYESTGPSISYWWALLSEWTYQTRREEQDDTLLVNFEWLVRMFSTFATKDGLKSFNYDNHAETIRLLPKGIAGYEDRLRLFEEMRKPTPAPRQRPAKAAS